MAHITTQPCRILMWTKDLITCEAEWCEKLEPTELLWHVKQTKESSHHAPLYWDILTKCREERGTNSQQTSHLCVASSQQARAGREPRGGNRPGPVQVGCTSDRPVIHWMTFTWGLKTVETTGRVTRWLGKSIERAVCVCVCVFVTVTDGRCIIASGQKSSLTTEKKRNAVLQPNYKYGVKKKKIK